MSINGELTKTDDGAFTGWIADLTFDVDITLIDNAYKTKETHPDFEVQTKTLRGRHIRVGSAWAQTSQAGNAYLSLAFDINGNQIRVNALPVKDEDGAYQILPWAT